MSFFDKIFGGKQEENQAKSFWNYIKDEEDLEKSN